MVIIGAGSVPVRRPILWRTTKALFPWDGLDDWRRFVGRGLLGLGVFGCGSIDVLFLGCLWGGSLLWGIGHFLIEFYDWSWSS
jgi:hypothetical protein